MGTLLFKMESELVGQTHMYIGVTWQRLEPIEAANAMYHRCKETPATAQETRKGLKLAFSIR